MLNSNQTHSLSEGDVSFCLSYDNGTKHKLLWEQTDFDFTVEQCLSYDHA